CGGATGHAAQLPAQDGDAEAQGVTLGNVPTNGWNDGSLSFYERIKRRFLFRCFDAVEVRYIMAGMIKGEREAHRILFNLIDRSRIGQEDFVIPTGYFALVDQDHHCSVRDALRIVVDELISNTDHIDPECETFLGFKWLEDTQTLKIVYFDDGEGNPEAEQRFGEIYTTTRKPNRGYGLRLVKYIVESLDGEVHFNSRSDLGTYIRITIPLGRINLSEYSRPFLSSFNDGNKSGRHYPPEQASFADFADCGKRPEPPADGGCGMPAVDIKDPNIVFHGQGDPLYEQYRSWGKSGMVTQSKDEQSNIEMIFRDLEIVPNSYIGNDVFNLGCGFRPIKSFGNFKVINFDPDYGGYGYGSSLYGKKEICQIQDRAAVAIWYGLIPFIKSHAPRSVLWNRTSGSSSERRQEVLQLSLVHTWDVIVSPGGYFIIAESKEYCTASPNCAYQIFRNFAKDVEEIHVIGGNIKEAIAIIIKKKAKPVVGLGGAEKGLINSSSCRLNGSYSVDNFVVKSALRNGGEEAEIRDTSELNDKGIPSKIRDTSPKAGCVPNLRMPNFGSNGRIR
ncbi:MAG: ATP-binding protein, partial [Candidatus Omnitrophota bacterium]